MWFKFEYEDYCCGSTYYESVPANKQPIVRAFKIERKRYIQPSSYTQKHIVDSIKRTKEIDGQEWVTYEKVRKLQDLPDDHTKWINPVKRQLDNGDFYYQFLETYEDWFIEINTIEEFIDLGGAQLSQSMENSPYVINELRISYKPDMVTYDPKDHPEPGYVGYELIDIETV